MLPLSSFLLDRLREPSSWRGVVWILSAFGLAISPDQAAAIMAAGAAVAGAIGLFTGDQPTASPGPGGSDGGASGFSLNPSDLGRRLFS